MRYFFSSNLRATPLGRWFLDEFPRRVKDSDGVARWMPRRLARLAATFSSQGEEAQLVLKHYAGGDVLDVGANWGGYSLLLAAKAKKGSCFLSLEPSGISYGVLIRNLAALSEIHPHVNYVALPLAAGNGDPAVFTFPMGDNYHPRVVSGEAGKDGAPTLRADDLLARHGFRPCFVKVDVEGAEVFVMEGMQALLREVRPVVMVEIHPHFQPSDASIPRILALLEQANYRLADTTVSPVTRQEFWVPNQ